MLTNVNVMKITLGSLLAIASDISSTSSISVLDSSARSVSTTLCQGLFRPCPFITLNLLFGRKLPMNKGTLVSLSAFPLGELKARSSVSRILPLPAALVGRGATFVLSLALPLGISRGRSSLNRDGIDGGGRGTRRMRPPTICIVPESTLTYGQFFIISNRKISNWSSQTPKANTLPMCPYCLKFRIARV